MSSFQSDDRPPSIGPGARPIDAPRGIIEKIRRESNCSLDNEVTHERLVQVVVVYWNFQKCYFFKGNRYWLTELFHFWNGIILSYFIHIFLISTCFRPLKKCPLDSTTFSLKAHRRLGRGWEISKSQKLEVNAFQEHRHRARSFGVGEPISIVTNNMFMPHSCSPSPTRNPDTHKV